MGTTLGQLQAMIVTEKYEANTRKGTLTCTLTLVNGFTVKGTTAYLGEHPSLVHMSQQSAYRKALDKLRECWGFHLAAMDYIFLGSEWVAEADKFKVKHSENESC